MEIDQLKSATEDQMEMMMMMMQMDKFPDFYGAYNDVSELLPSETDPGSGANNGSMPHFNDKNGPNVDSPSFINLPSTMPFTGTTTPVQQPSIPAFLSYSTNERFCRGANEDLSGTNSCSTPAQKRNSMAAMRETIFRIAAMQPVHIDPESVKPPKRRNVKISKDPQSVAARHRRERISERIRILQRLVPGGTKMDTASMLDEAIHYVKFLKTQVQSLERAAANRPTGIGFPAPFSNNGSYLALGKAYQSSQNDQHFGDS
ncbi:hypothetical protein ACOSP7_010676 [Xanthoceras sorbifolium]|uniref:BHLH domain-containing protein n=1 Tax=Xanthoceras sorbifolium TaxID=99658 RepID=A0ABQ8HSV0_9ROSI|nr:hypothetical protein JRO89_XS07G0072800 [Xanthoceras sorbifolium]